MRPVPAIVRLCVDSLPPGQKSHSVHGSFFPTKLESLRMSLAIQTIGLTKRYRRLKALDNLDLSINAGGVHALVGPNGAGKTTLIKILMNILRATSGTASVAGIDSSKISGKAFQTIGYVSENQKLPDWMRVGNFLKYLRPFYPTWDTQLEAQLVQQFDLPLDRKLKHLSRGMQMKAALASALAFRPKLIILDEPFSGLDPMVRDELGQALVDRAADSTIFFPRPRRNRRFRHSPDLSRRRPPPPF